VLQRFERFVTQWPEIQTMRAETQKLVEEIKQSVELLRRSL
jgi:hypothetical protein